MNKKSKSKSYTPARIQQLRDQKLARQSVEAFSKIMRVLANVKPEAATRALNAALVIHQP